MYQDIGMLPDWSVNKMIGTKFFKENFDGKNYADAAKWCNANGATIEDKGEYYEVVEIPAQTFNEFKTIKLTQIDEWTAAKITGGFVSSASGEPVRYDSDVETQITMQGIALNVNTEQFAEKYPTGCPVRGVADGQNCKSVFWLNPSQVMKWMADLSMHIGGCKQEGWKKQAEVEACKTVFELDNIEL